jgi:hypothetical protein
MSSIISPCFERCCRWTVGTPARQELCRAPSVDPHACARTTAPVRNRAPAQARNRQENRKYQAPVIAAWSCEMPRKHWGFGRPTGPVFRKKDEMGHFRTAAEMLSRADGRMTGTDRERLAAPFVPRAAARDPLYPSGVNRRGAISSRPRAGGAWDRLYRF